MKSDTTPKGIDLHAPASALASPAPATRRASRSRRLARGFTLVEVLIASLVLTVTCGGILAMIIQSRRLTDGSIVQNSIVTVMQGYIEQIKSMEYGLITPSPAGVPGVEILPIPTVQDESHPDALSVSYGTPPTALPALGTTPTGAIDNLKHIQIRTPLKPDGTPGPLNPSDTIELTVWVWVQDLTDLANNVGGSKAITIIYTYQFRDGGRIKSIRSSLRTIRSVVPSF